MKKLFILLLMAAAMFCACDNSSDSPAATVPPVPAPVYTAPILNSCGFNNPAEDFYLGYYMGSFDSVRDITLSISVEVTDPEKDVKKIYISVKDELDMDVSGFPFEADLPAMSAETHEYTQSVAAHGVSAGTHHVSVYVEDEAGLCSVIWEGDFTVENDPRV